MLLPCCVRSNIGGGASMSSRQASLGMASGNAAMLSGGSNTPPMPLAPAGASAALGSRANMVSNPNMVSGPDGVHSHGPGHPASGLRSTPLVSGGPGASPRPGPGGGNYAPIPGSEPFVCGPAGAAFALPAACAGFDPYCCEPGPAQGAHNVQWVKASGGGYQPVMTYKYVGEGSGTWERQVTTSWYGWRMRKCCIAIMGFLFLASLLYLILALSGIVEAGELEEPSGEVAVSTSPAPAQRAAAPTTALPRPPATVAPAVVAAAAVPPGQPVAPVTLPPLPSPKQPVRTAPARTCLIFGDPHIKTFDGQRADYYTSGEYWLVKSNTVKIQGKYKPTRITNGLAVTKELAIGGSFIQGHKLIVGVDSVTWDGMPVITGFDSLGATWASTDPQVHVTYNGVGTVMQESRDPKALHVLHIQMPDGVKLEINRWAKESEGRYINTRLMMPPQPGMDGHCGNGNGDPQDDSRTSVRQRLGKMGVAEGDLLFPGPKTEISPGKRPDLNDCPEGKLKLAMARCKQVEHAFFPSHACIVDACLGHLGPHAV